MEVRLRFFIVEKCFWSTKRFWFLSCLIYLEYIIIYMRKPQTLTANNGRQVNSARPAAKNVSSVVWAFFYIRNKSLGGSTLKKRVRCRLEFRNYLKRRAILKIAKIIIKINDRHCVLNVSKSQALGMFCYLNGDYSLDLWCSRIMKRRKPFARNFAELLVASLISC